MTVGVIKTFFRITQLMRQAHMVQTTDKLYAQKMFKVCLHISLDAFFTCYVFFSTKKGMF